MHVRPVLGGVAVPEGGCAAQLALGQSLGQRIERNRSADMAISVGEPRHVNGDEVGAGVDALPGHHAVNRGVVLLGVDGCGFGNRPDNLDRVLQLRQPLTGSDCRLCLGQNVIGVDLLAVVVVGDQGELRGEQWLTRSGIEHVLGVHSIGIPLERQWAVDGPVDQVPDQLLGFLSGLGIGQVDVDQSQGLEANLEYPEVGLLVEFFP